MNEITQTTALTPQQQYEMAQADKEAHMNNSVDRSSANEAKSSSQVETPDYGGYSTPTDFSWIEETDSQEYSNTDTPANPTEETGEESKEDIPSVTPIDGKVTTWEELEDKNNPWLKMQKYLDSLTDISKERKLDLSVAYELAISEGFDPKGYENRYNWVYGKSDGDWNNDTSTYAEEISWLKGQLRNENLSEEDRDYISNRLKREEQWYRNDKIYLDMYKPLYEKLKKEGLTEEDWNNSILGNGQEYSKWMALARIPEPEDFISKYTGSASNNENVRSGYGTVSDDRESSITDSKYSGYKENAKNSNIAKNYNAGMGKEVEEAVSDKYCKIFRTVLKSEPDYIKKILIAIPKNHAESEW